MTGNNLLLRRDNETELDYERRIVYGKLEDKTLAEYDYSELAEYLYGKSYNSDVARRMFYGSKITLDKIGTELGQENFDAAREVQLKMEMQKLKDQRTALNKLIREEARQRDLLAMFKDQFSSAKLPVLESGVPVYEVYGEEDLLVSLNDIHYGYAVDNHWTQYNPDIFVEMLNDYAEKIVRIQERHNCNTCYVFNNGDTISGNIHHTIQLQNRLNVVEQIKGVSELIAQFLAVLAGYFEKVVYISVAGNHSRLQSKDDSLPGERMDDLVGWYVKARLENVHNVEVEENYFDPTMYKLNVRGKTYLGVHGDYDFHNGKLKMSSLQAMAGEPIYAVLCGHKHHNCIDTVNGVKMLMAGSFLGTDDYCVTKRILGRPQQLVTVVGEEGIVCHYDIDL